MLRKTFLFAALIGLSMMLSSCFVDYGLDTNNYDVVATSYNPEYPFSTVTKYAMIDSIVHYGTDDVTRAYDNQIKSRVRSNLNALGWQEVTDSTANVTIMMGTTSSTTQVYGSSSWWDYYSWYPGWSYYPSYGSGYSWYYPYYPSGYDYAYSYTTGSVVVSMVDLRKGADNKLPVQWIAVMNGLVNASDASSRINTAIDKAFSQSPYLK